MRVRLLKRHRVGLVLLGLLVLIAALVVYRLEDQQARAVTRTRPEPHHPMLYVMLEERFPRRVSVSEGAPALQGDMA